MMEAEIIRERTNLSRKLKKCVSRFYEEKDNKRMSFSPVLGSEPSALIMLGLKCEQINNKVLSS